MGHGYLLLSSLFLCDYSLAAKAAQKLCAEERYRHYGSCTHYNSTRNKYIANWYRSHLVELSCPTRNILWSKCRQNAWMLVWAKQKFAYLCVAFIEVLLQQFFSECYERLNSCVCAFNSTLTISVGCTQERTRNRFYIWSLVLNGPLSYILWVSPAMVQTAVLNLSAALRPEYV